MLYIQTVYVIFITNNLIKKKLVECEMTLGSETGIWLCTMTEYFNWGSI